MYSTCWEIIKDDARKTFEVCGRKVNSNFFTNGVHGMQKAGMSVSCLTPPVSNKTASKELIKISGYKKEDGLLERLLKEYKEITRRDFGEYS